MANSWWLYSKLVSSVTLWNKFLMITYIYMTMTIPYWNIPPQFIHQPASLILKLILKQCQFLFSNNGHQRKCFNYVTRKHQDGMGTPQFDNVVLIAPEGLNNILIDSNYKEVSTQRCQENLPQPYQISQRD